MKGEVYNPSLCNISKMAYMYYIEGKSRTAIAKEMGISASTISRMLKKAKEESIIEISMPKKFLECNQMENQIKEQFGLDYVVVVPVEEETQTNEEEIKKQVALEGARYLQRIISDGDVLGMAWGGTMYYLIQYLNPCRKVDASILTIHGSIFDCDSKLAVKALVKRAAMAFGGKHEIISGVGLHDSVELAHLEQEKYKKIFKLMKEISIAVCGVGSPLPPKESLLFKEGYLNKEELGELKAQQVCCDLVLRFIDREGKECETSLVDRTLSIDLKEFKNIPCKIIVASGSFKSEAVMATLKGGLANVLIIDSNIAKRLVSIK